MMGCAKHAQGHIINRVDLGIDERPDVFDGFMFVRIKLKNGFIP